MHVSYCRNAALPQQLSPTNQIHAIKTTNHFERVISKILRKLSVSFQLCLTKLLNKTELPKKAIIF